MFCTCSHVSCPPVSTHNMLCVLSCARTVICDAPCCSAQLRQGQLLRLDWTEVCGARAPGRAMRRTVMRVPVRHHTCTPSLRGTRIMRCACLRPRQSSFAGSHASTFRLRVQHKAEYDVSKGDREKVTASALPNIRTNPAKKGGFGVPNVTLGKVTSSSPASSSSSSTPPPSVRTLPRAR